MKRLGIMLGILGVVLVVVFASITVFSSQQLRSIFADTPEGNNNMSGSPTTGPTASPDVLEPFTPYSAQFAVYTNGTFRVFTQSMYHNRSDDAYIEADNPNTVQVMKPNLTWIDFLSTLPFTITPECLTTGSGEQFCNGEDGELRFFINGEEKDQALFLLIREGDILLITYGSDDDEIQKQLKELETM